MRKWLFILAVLAGLTASQVSAQNMIDAAGDRSDSADVITLRFDAPVEYNTFELKKPRRVVFDFPGAVLSFTGRQLEIDSSRISTVRWAQNTTNPDNVRVVADLKDDSEQEFSAKKADGGKTVILTFKSKDVPVEIVNEAKPAEGHQQEEVSTTEALPFSKEISPAGKLRFPRLPDVAGLSVVLAGKKFPLGKKPLFDGTSLMVPAKEFFEHCGFTTLYEKKTKTFRAYLGQDIEAIVMYNSKEIIINGVKRPLQHLSRVEGGKLMVPLMSAVKWIGYGSYFDEKTSALYLAPRVTKMAWEIKNGTNSVVIETTTPIATYETEDRAKPLMHILTLPDYILDVPSDKVSVKEEGVAGIKAFQKGKDVKIGVYLQTKQVSRMVVENNSAAISFPPAVAAIKVTEEASGLKIDIEATRPVQMDERFIADPDRLILDFENALFAVQNQYEVNKAGVQRIRASQFKTDPLVTRIVIDLADGTDAKVTRFDDNSTFSVIVKKEKAVQPKPKPKTVKALKGRIIVIDPGHGGADPGAFGYSGEGVREKMLNLQTSHKLAKYLSEAGAVVQMTREDDTDVDLKSRVEFAANNKAAILVSMHYNSIEKPGISGTETYYFNPDSKLLATTIHRRLAAGLGRTDRGVQKVKFYVIYHSEMPSALVEPLYISNSDEEKLARDPSYQDKIAKHVFEGIKDYFEIMEKF